MSATTEKFDLALKKSLGGRMKDFYKTSDEKKPYPAYYTNAEWDKFRKGMSLQDQNAYSDGGGKELEEKNYRGTMVPPKMASYASSSRFVYTLLRKELCNNDVVFEQKLPTGIKSSVPNMDAFLATSKEFIFVEAKCHEIYASPSPKYKTAFKEFYDIISKKTEFSYEPAAEVNDSSVTFKYNAEPIKRFDIKQTIAHIRSIAYACINGVVVKDGKVEKRLMLAENQSPVFAYLVYNPEDLKDFVEDEKAWKAIDIDYKKEINFIDNRIKDGFFNKLFEISLGCLGCNEDKIKSLSKRFKVVRADQKDIKKIIR